MQFRAALSHSGSLAELGNAPVHLLAPKTRMGLAYIKFLTSR